MTTFRSVQPVVLALALLSAGGAFADEYKCHGPIGDWQPRDAVVAAVKQMGITPDRLKIDDGCYEIRARDADGNRVRLKLDPVSLAPVELRVEFQPGADPSPYLAGLRGPAAPGGAGGAPKDGQD